MERGGKTDGMEVKRRCIGGETEKVREEAGKHREMKGGMKE